MCIRDRFIFAFAALKWSVGKYILSRISLGVQSVIDYAKEGISFIFGSLSNDGSIFAVNVLGVIIFISALVSALYYLGEMCIRDRVMMLLIVRFLA